MTAAAEAWIPRGGPGIRGLDQRAQQGPTEPDKAGANKQESVRMTEIKG